MVKALLGLAVFGSFGCATASKAPPAPITSTPAVACEGPGCGANPSVACETPDCDTAPAAKCEGAACPPPCEGPKCAAKTTAAPAPACKKDEPGCTTQPILELR